jgi:hypothetical protein
MSILFVLPITPSRGRSHASACESGPFATQSEKDEKTGQTREREAVTGVEKKEGRKVGFSYQLREKPLCDTRASWPKKHTGRNKNIDRGAGSFNFVRFNYFLN